VGRRRDRWRAALPGGRSYWFYEAPSALIDGQDPLAAVGAERWPAPMPAQLAATPPATVLVNRILRLGALATWTRGTVALLGDAVHAMEPCEHSVGDDLAVDQHAVAVEDHKLYARARSHALYVPPSQSAQPAAITTSDRTL
jgi:hypothetical protein